MGNLITNGDPRVHELMVDVAVLKTRLEEANKALERQASEYERRLGELNQSHDQAERVLATYLTRESFEQTLKILEERTETRLSTLELRNAEQSGGKKALAGLLAAAGTVGGVIASIIGYLWLRY